MAQRTLAAELRSGRSGSPHIMSAVHHFNQILNKYLNPKPHSVGE